MNLFLNYLLLAFLFIVLGACADLAVQNIKYIATASRMRIFALGVLLGVITSLPELSVGLNASLEGVTALSVGNLIGGVIVLIGFVLGASLLFGRQIKTDKSMKSLIPEALFILLPILLGLDGKFGLIDGLILVIFYFTLLFYLYRFNRTLTGDEVVFLERSKIIKSLFLALIGMAGMMLAAHWVILMTVDLLTTLNISKLFVGMFVFSIGTNLPEIIITFTSWRRQAMELSVSHLMSSAFSNILILGLLSVINPIAFTLSPTYYVLAIFLIILIIAFSIFVYTNKRLDRREGSVLLAIYLLFLFTNIYIISR